MKNCSISFVGLAVIGFILTATPLWAQQPTSYKSFPIAPVVESLDEVSRRLGGPTLVTLHLKDVTQQAALDELVRQSGAPLRFKPWSGDVPTRPLVTVDIEKMPFWEAMRAVVPNEYVGQIWTGGPNGAITIGVEQTPVSRQRLFLMVAVHLGRARAGSEFFFANRREVRHSGSFEFKVLADPKLKLVGKAYNAIVNEAVDENGVSFVKPGKRFYAMDELVDYPDPSAVELENHYQIDLTLPPKIGQRIARLNGFVSFLEARQTFRWEIPIGQNMENLSKDFTFDGITMRYTIDSFKPVEQGYQLKWRGEITQQTPRGDSMGRRFADPKVSLIDDKGRAFLGGAYFPSGPQDQFTQSVSFSDSVLPSLEDPPEIIKATGKAAKIVIEIPHDIVQIKAPFQFTDLPLPAVE